MGYELVPKQEVDNENTCVLVAALENPDGGVVPVGSITTATLDLWDERTGDAIGTLDRDVAGSIDGGGNFRYVLAVSDNAIQETDSENDYEDHLATLKIVFVAGSETHTLKKNWRVRVLNNNYNGN